MRLVFLIVLLSFEQAQAHTIHAPYSLGQFSLPCRKFKVLQKQETFPHRVGQIIVKGVERFSSEYIVHLFGMKPGGRLRQKDIEKGVERIKEVYLKLGFIRVAVSVKQETEQPGPEVKEGVANIAILVSEGNRYLIRRIEVSGNRKTNYKVVLRAAGLRPGDPYDPRAVNNWVRSLNRSGRFTKVSNDNIEISINGQRYFVDIVINLKEKDL